MPRYHRRFEKKEIKKDEFAETIEKAVRIWRKHGRQIIGAVLLVCLVIVIALFAIRGRREAQIAAQAILAEANMDAGSGNFSAALSKYHDIIERYRGTWAHSDAVFFAGNAHFYSGSYDSAMVFFDRYLSLKKRRPEFTISAKIGKAQCLEELGRYKEAADYYLQLQKENPESPLASDALFGAARCYRNLGDYELAERTYRDLIEKYPESNQSEVAKVLLLEVQAILRE